jgi:hypothetical protein
MMRDGSGISPRDVNVGFTRGEDSGRDQTSIASNLVLLVLFSIIVRNPAGLLPSGLWVGRSPLYFGSHI